MILTELFDFARKSFATKNLNEILHANYLRPICEQTLHANYFAFVLLYGARARGSTDRATDF